MLAMGTTKALLGLFGLLVAFAATSAQKDESIWKGDAVTGVHHPMPAPIKSGWALCYSGTLPKSCSRVYLNLRGPSDTPILVHLDSRFSYNGYKNTIVVNQNRGGRWGRQINWKTFPYVSGSEFYMTVRLVSDTSVEVLVNGQVVGKYDAGTSLSAVTAVQVENVKCPVSDSYLNVNSACSKDKAVWRGDAVANVHHPMPAPIAAGWALCFSGTLPQKCSRFNVNLRGPSSIPVMVHIDSRFSHGSKNVIVVNQIRGGRWQRQINWKSFPYVSGSKFYMTVRLVSDTSVEVLVNGQVVGQYDAGKPLSDVTAVHIEEVSCPIADSYLNVLSACSQDLKPKVVAQQKKPVVAIAKSPVVAIAKSPVVAKVKVEEDEDETPVNGAWSAWSNTACTVTCGSGSKTRMRKCDSPAPAKGGNACAGDAYEVLPCTCNAGVCPGRESVSGPIDTADVGTGVVWAVNNKGAILYRQGVAANQPWTTIPGSLSQISVSSSGVIWGTNKNQYIFVRLGASSTNPGGVRWQQVPGKLSQLSAGHNMMWGVNAHDAIYYRGGITDAKPEGSYWKHVSGKLRHISVAPSGAVWGISSNQLIWYRTGVKGPSHPGTGWKWVGGMAVQVSVGESGVWVVNKNGNIYYREGTYGATTNSYGTRWTHIPGQLVNVHSGASGVVGVNKDGYVYVRDGVSKDNPKGTSWRVINRHS